VVPEARKLNLPIVIDGDALHLIARHPELIRGYRRAVLTPNAMEFKTLYQAVATMLRSEAPLLPAEEALLNSSGDVALLHAASTQTAGQADVSQLLAGQLASMYVHA